MRIAWQESKNNFELIIELVDVIIWPIIVFSILLLFRKNVAHTIQRLGSLKADKTGISLIFQEKVAQLKQIGRESGMLDTAKSGASVSGAIISGSGSPHEQLEQLHQTISERLIQLAAENGMNPADFSSATLIDKFKETGIFDLQKANYTKMLLEVTALVDPKISQRQVNEIKSLYAASKL